MTVEEDFKCRLGVFLIRLPLLTEGTYFYQPMKNSFYFDHPDVPTERLDKLWNMLTEIEKELRQNVIPQS